MKQLIKTAVHVTVFGIAMGFLETAVVVYLRELYYPEGFSFPLKTMPGHIIITELLRELATIIMLAYVGILSGKNFNQRFAFFLLSFAVWDLFYYVFLKVLLNWPLSVLEWDVLFLIPAPWVGPVLAPCMVSASMILFAVILLYKETIASMRIRVSDWLVLIAISILYVFSFTKDQFDTLYVASGSIINMTHVYVPTSFNWYLFAVPFLLFCLWLVGFANRKQAVNHSLLG